MKFPFPNSAPAALALALVLGGADSARAGSLNGPVAKGDFQSWTTNHGGVFLNFNGLLAGGQLYRQWQARYGVSFATTTDATGRPLPTPTPVVVSANYAYNLGRLTLVGSPCRGCFDDHGCDYEIRFVTPQRWAGLQRYWRGPTLTRFIAPNNDVLAEVEGEGFQAWLSEGDSTNTWVARIEISGRDRGGSRQVGYSDDLVYGTNAIPRLLGYLSLRSTSQAVIDGLNRPWLTTDYRVRTVGDTNEFFLQAGTNAPAGGTNGAPGRLKGDLLIEPE